MKMENALFILRVVQNAGAVIHRMLDPSPSFDVLQDQVTFLQHLGQRYKEGQS